MEHMEKQYKVPLHVYTLGEELVNSISHGVGALFSIAVLVLCVVRAAQHGSMVGVVSSIVYGICMLLMYSASTIYHALKPNLAKRVFRVLDHCMVFLLIAGTYTPCTLVLLQGTLGWTLFGAVWTTAIAGIVLNAIDMKKFEILSMVCYLVMGWAIIVAIKPLMAALPHDGLVLLVAGGVSYTLGAILYGIGAKVRWIHCVWHFFVLAGSVLHFLCIFLYIL